MKTEKIPSKIKLRKNQMKLKYLQMMFSQTMNLMLIMIKMMMMTLGVMGIKNNLVPMIKMKILTINQKKRKKILLNLI